LFKSSNSKYTLRIFSYIVYRFYHLIWIITQNKDMDSLGYLERIS